MVCNAILGAGKPIRARDVDRPVQALHCDRSICTLRLSTHAHGGDGSTEELVAPIFFSNRGSFPARIRPANPDHSSKAYAGFL